LNMMPSTPSATASSAVDRHVARFSFVATNTATTRWPAALSEAKGQRHCVEGAGATAQAIVDRPLAREQRQLVDVDPARGELADRRVVQERAVGDQG